MIPKIIHYCWFGGSEKPLLVEECLQSWKKHLPEYLFLEWNDTNCDFDTPFVKQAYLLKKWAFVADYIRLSKLYEHGGVYLDTDMLILKGLDQFLHNQAFLGLENTTHISCGIMGSLPRHTFFEECLHYYSDINFSPTPIPQIITKVYRDKYNFKADFKSNEIITGDVTIYPPEYFYPLPYDKKEDVGIYETYLKSNSAAIHFWVASWQITSELDLLRQKRYIKGFIKFIINFFKQRNKSKYIKDVLSVFKLSRID